MFLVSFNTVQKNWITDIAITFIKNACLKHFPFVTFTFTFGKVAFEFLQFCLANANAMEFKEMVGYLFRLISSKIRVFTEICEIVCMFQ